MPTQVCCERCRPALIIHDDADILVDQVRFRADLPEGFLAVFIGEIDAHDRHRAAINGDDVIQGHEELMVPPIPGRRDVFRQDFMEAAVRDLAKFHRLPRSSVGGGRVMTYSPRPAPLRLAGANISGSIACRL